MTSRVTNFLYLPFPKALKDLVFILFIYIIRWRRAGGGGLLFVQKFGILRKGGGFATWLGIEGGFLRKGWMVALGG
jgi:hypothetical protein